MSEWYEIDAAWDATGNASDALLKLGETSEWCDLMGEVARSTHATAEEAYDGMAKALRNYLESLDNLTAFSPYDAQFVPNDNPAPEKVVSGEAVDVTPEKRSKTEQDGLEPHSNLLEPDSREKLEAAAQTAAGYIYGRGFTNGLADAWNDDEVDTAANRIIQLLDRQAAITRAEIYEGGEWDCATCDAKTALQAKVDDLEREVGYWQWRHIHFLDDYAELDADLGEHERALHRAEHERDEFREKLSRALDLAHEIGMIQP